MTKRLLAYFLHGLIYVAPIAITVYAVISLLQGLDSIIPMDIPGLGFVILISGITAIGFIGEYALKLRIVSLVDRLLERMPLVKILYSSVKDLTKSLTGKKKGFDAPVLLKLSPDHEVRRVGFITDEQLSSLGSPSKDLVAVYVPHSLAISGQLFMVPKEYVEPLDASSADVMKYIIAGGVA